jgi:hypothetical protein
MFSFRYQSFVVPPAGRDFSGVRVHFCGWPISCDETIPTAQLSSRIRPRRPSTLYGASGPESEAEVRSMYNAKAKAVADSLLPGVISSTFVPSSYFLSNSNVASRTPPQPTQRFSNISGVKIICDQVSNIQFYRTATVCIKLKHEVLHFHLPHACYSRSVAGKADCLGTGFLRVFLHIIYVFLVLCQSFFKKNNIRPCSFMAFPGCMREGGRDCVAVGT